MTKAQTVGCICRIKQVESIYDQKGHKFFLQM